MPSINTVRVQLEYLHNGRKTLAGGWRSIVEILFDKENRQGRTRWRHTRIERRSLQNRKLQNRSSPLNRVLIHMLPRCVRHTRLGRNCVLNRDLKSGCERDNQGKQDKANKRPAPHPARLNLCSSECLHRIHSKNKVIIRRGATKGYSELTGPRFMGCENTVFGCIFIQVSYVTTRFHRRLRIGDCPRKCRNRDGSPRAGSSDRSESPALRMQLYFAVAEPEVSAFCKSR